MRPGDLPGRVVSVFLSDQELAEAQALADKLEASVDDAIQHALHQDLVRRFGLKPTHTATVTNLRGPKK